MATPLGRKLLLTSAARLPLATTRPTLLRLPLPALTASRPLSTSRLLNLAQPTTSPSTLQSGPIKTPNPKDAALAGITGKEQEGGVVYTDYSKGPSAIDKAAQLFFFTEILRGT